MSHIVDQTVTFPQREAVAGMTLRIIRHGERSAAGRMICIYCAIDPAATLAPPVSGIGCGARRRVGNMHVMHVGTSTYVGVLLGVGSR